MNISKINANSSLGFQGKLKLPKVSMPKFEKPEDKKEAFKKAALITTGLAATAAIVAGTVMLVKKGKLNKAVKAEAAERATENAMTQKDKILRSLPGALQTVLNEPLKEGETIGQKASTKRAQSAYDR